MSTPLAIGRVSLALQKLLKDEMGVENCEVTLLAPNEGQGRQRARINLFLYKVEESAPLRNLDWQRQPHGMMVPPPLSLNLFYLLTPFALIEEPAGEAAAHELLGLAMGVFFRNPVLPAPLLEEVGLDDSREEISIMLTEPDMDELSKIWTTFGESFRLSVLYEVSVVQLDAGEPQPEAVRVVDIALDAGVKTP